MAFEAVHLTGCGVAERGFGMENSRACGDTSGDCSWGGVERKIDENRGRRMTLPTICLCWE